MGKRMYYVLKIILESKEECIKAKEIAEGLKAYDIDVDVKTIYTAIQNINAFFFAWLQCDLIEKRHSRGYFIQKGLLSDGELQFLLDSIAFHQDLNHEDKEKLKQKLLFLSPYHQQKRLITFEPTQKKFSFSLLINLSTIMKAIENKKTIMFQYINYEIDHHHFIEIPSQKGNDKDRYIVSPYQIVSQNNHYYLLAYNELHPEQLTNYRIDRMRTIQITQYKYHEIREQFDMIDEIEKMTNMYVSHQRDTLQLECDQRLLREIVSRFGADIEAHRLYQDHYLIIVENTPISEGLIGWIMMMQSQIKIISPLFLQEEIKKRIKNMSSLYEDVI